MEHNSKICYDIEDLYNLLPLGKNRIYSLVKSHGFPSIQIGKKFLIPKHAFEKWLEEQISPTSQ